MTNTIIATGLVVLAAGLGGLPFLFVSQFPSKIASVGWAASGGVMLAAAVFSLIMPGVEADGITTVATGIFAGTAVMVLASLFTRSRRDAADHSPGKNGQSARHVLLTLLVHSIPEGVAIGVAFGSGEPGLGLVIAVAIAIHNIPEGITASIPLRAEGAGGRKCVGWAILANTPQLLAAIPAYLLVSAYPAILPYAFGAAAGAMILIVMNEMIPESRDDEAYRLAHAISAVIGFLAMMVLQDIVIH